MKIKHIHHVAYRCKDAKQTVEWYQRHLNMDFILAFAEDHVPSTKAPDPYMHIFLDAGNGNVLAFFELPNSPEMGRDVNTPEWVQHIVMALPLWHGVELIRGLTTGILSIDMLWHVLYYVVMIAVGLVFTTRRLRALFLG